MVNSMPKDSDLSKEDIALFRDAVKGAKPLQQSKISPGSPKSTVKFKSHQQEEAAEGPLVNLPADNITSWVNSDTPLRFARSGVQRAYLQKLMKGKLRPSMQLDTHGLSVEEAKITLHQFIQNCTLQHIRVLLVIHGKGHRSTADKPILKNYINHWLRQYDEVLAFCSALAKDGGTGAVYVLLRRC